MSRKRYGISRNTRRRTIQESHAEAGFAYKTLLIIVVLPVVGVIFAMWLLATTSGIANWVRQTDEDVAAVQYLVDDVTPFASAYLRSNTLGEGFADLYLNSRQDLIIDLAVEGLPLGPYGLTILDGATCEKPLIAYNPTGAGEGERALGNLANVEVADAPVANAVSIRARPSEGDFAGWDVIGRSLAMTDANQPSELHMCGEIGPIGAMSTH